MKMKELLKKPFMWAMLLMATLLVSCQYVGTPEEEEPENDSVWLYEELQQVTNPTFSSLEEIMVYRQSMIDANTTDSIFVSLSDPILRNVTAVVLKNYKEVSKTSIVDEYPKNKRIYDNLLSAEFVPAPPEEKKETVEPPSEIKYKVDTVGDKVVLTKITE